MGPAVQCLNFLKWFHWFVDSWYTTWLYNERRWWRRRWGSPNTLDSSSLWGWLWSWRASWVPAIMSAPITQTFSLVCCILVVFFNLLHYEKFYGNEDLLMKLYVNFHSKVLYSYPWFEKKKLICYKHLYGSVVIILHVAVSMNTEHFFTVFCRYVFHVHHCLFVYVKDLPDQASRHQCQSTHLLSSNGLCYIHCSHWSGAYLCHLQVYLKLTLPHFLS